MYARTKQPQGDFNGSIPDAIRREIYNWHAMNMIYHRTSHVHSLMHACTRIPFVAMVQGLYTCLIDFTMSVSKICFRRAYFSANCGVPQ